LITNKTCFKCGENKSLDEFSRNKSKKDGMQTYCKKCNAQYNKKYRKGHKKRVNASGREYYERVGRQKAGHQSMYENKNSSLYLGVVIAERLCRHLFKDVEVMPRNNPKFDFICNKGKKIDVKSSCMSLKNRRSPWSFTIDHNTIADFFILVAFDNRTNLNPLYLWMIPGHILNKQGSANVSPSTIHKWNEWKRDINDAQLCCAEMKEKKRKIRR